MLDEFYREMLAEKQSHQVKQTCKKERERKKEREKGVMCEKRNFNYVIFLIFSHLPTNILSID